MDVKTELERNAIAEARRKDLEFIQRTMDIQWLNNRMEDGRMGRCLALIKQEAEMEKDFQERTDHAAIVNAKAKKETLLGIEVAKVQREATCELQRRHYLRERDPSLRQLARKLQAGYVCRDLKQQILNNQYRRLQEQAEERQANDLLFSALNNEKESIEKEALDKMTRNMEYCKELQQQLVNRQRVKQCLYEDTLIEKKMLDEITRTIADEDQRELRQKHEQMEKMRREMVTFAQAREAWRAKQTLMVVDEERQIEEQNKAASDRSSSIVAAREEKMRQKEELNARIAAKILADEAERQDRENVIKSLQEQEFLEKNVNNDIAEREKMERVKTETKDALTEQMETRKRLAREQREREAQFRLGAEAKMAADEQKEKEKERKVKEKRQKYALELRKQIEDNARRRKIEQNLEEGRAQYVWDTNKAWCEEVAKEREKIIEEHVPHLLGHIQAGAVSRADLPAVRRGLRPPLDALNIDSLTTSRRVSRHPKCNAQCMILRDY